MHYPDHHDDHYHGDVPSADFWGQVDDYNPWEEDLTQGDYEGRLATEAQLMVALEAIREILVDLDYEIDNLEDHISENDDRIRDNDEGIDRNDDGIAENDAEISDQEYRVKRLNKRCQRYQARLEEDRQFLELHCQQFAFAPDMVGACADILTCIDTRLSYRADVFDHPPVVDDHDHDNYDDDHHHHH
jgi:hypothetical protein